MFERLIKNRRGVSAVIGTIFFVLVVLMASGFIIWETARYDEYMQAVNERNRLEWERKNEVIEILSTSVANGKLSVAVANKGAVTAHLVNLWLTEYASTNPNWHENYTISHYLNPGSITNIGSELETPELDPTLTYRVKVVTERGNIAVAIYSLEDEPPPVRAFGVFSLDWFYFEYSSKQHPEPISAGSISKTEDYIAFYVKVTNNWNENITILGPSMIMLLIEWQEPLFYIVEAVDYDPSTPSIIEYDEEDPIMVEPQESKILTFAAKSKGEEDWAWGNSRWPYWRGDLPIGIWQGDTPEGAIVMTALVFTIGDSSEIQAQSLPFQALVLDE